MPHLIRRPAFAAALLIAGLLASGGLSSAHATGTTQPESGLPTDLPTLSSEPEVAQRQALGCTVVGLGLTGVALASGVVATGGGAAAGGAVVAELLAYFGAGCTMGAFIATAFPVPGAGAQSSPPTQAPANDPTLDKRRLRIEAAALLP